MKKPLFVRQTNVVSAFRLVACLLLAIAMAFGQGTTGPLDITLTDSTGALIPGATLTATNTGTGVESQTTTDADGRCKFQLRAGAYRIVVQQPGFEKLGRDNVIVNSANSVHLDLRLALGTVSESLVVEAQTPLLQSGCGDRARGGATADNVGAAGEP